MIKVDDNKDYAGIAEELKSRVNTSNGEFTLDGNILTIDTYNGIQIVIDLDNIDGSYVDFDKCYDDISGQVSFIDAVGYMSDMSKSISLLSEVYEELNDMYREFEYEDEEFEEPEDDMMDVDFEDDYE